MAVRKSDDRWVVEFMQRGIRVFRRLPAGRTKGDAQQLESKLRGQIFNAVDLGKLPDPLLGKVIDEWFKAEVVGSKSESKSRSHTNAALYYAGSARLSEVAQVAPKLGRSVPRQGVSGQGRVLAAGTTNRRLSVLKATCKYAFDKGYIADNLSAKIKLLPEKKYQRREFATDLAETLIEAARTPRAKALVAIAAYTGMRLGEVLKLDPERDIKPDHLIARDRKHGGDTAIPILPPLRPHLKQLPFKGNWRNIYRGWLAARKRAGVSIRYHDLRHMAATAMANAGVDGLVIADILGHSSMQTTRKYTHPSLETKAKAMRSITSGLHQGEKKKARR